VVLRCSNRMPFWAQQTKGEGWDVKSQSQSSSHNPEGGEQFKMWIKMYKTTALRSKLMEFSTSFSMVICGWVQSSPLYRWHKFSLHQPPNLPHAPFTTDKGILPQRLPQETDLLWHTYPTSSPCPFYAPPSCTFLYLCKFTTSPSHRRCVLLRMHSSRMHVNAFYHSLIMMVAFEVLTKS